MKKIIWIILFLGIQNSLICQNSIGIIRVANTSTKFEKNLPVGTKIFSEDTKLTYTLIKNENSNSKLSSLVLGTDYSIAIQNQSKYAQKGSFWLTDSALIDKFINVGMLKTNLPTGINYYDTINLTDNNERFGIVSQGEYYKTSAPFTAPIVGVLGRVYLDSLNTQNWTHEFGLVGLEGSIRAQKGASGIISNSISILSRTELDAGARFTNSYGMFIEQPTNYKVGFSPADSIIANSYGIYVGPRTHGYLSNYAIYTTSGLVHFGDNTDISGILSVTGPITSSGVIKAGTTSEGVALYNIGSTVLFYGTSGSPAHIFPYNNGMNLFIGGISADNEQFNTIIIQGQRLKIISNVPTSAVGSNGDKAGMVAFDVNYIYYCTALYDGITHIWKRVALSTW